MRSFRFFGLLLTLPYLISTIYPATVEPQLCGRVNEAQLWNGELLTQPNEHPWIGKIEGNDGVRGLLCVAILIGARHALTASRCVHDPSVEIKGLIFGDWSSGNTNNYITAKAKQKVPVDKIIIHPDYKYGEFGNNLAIIVLKENVVNTDFVQPICLPSAEHQKSSEDLTVAGYESPFLQAIPIETRRIKFPFECRGIGF